jgi:hypothetical protein
MLHGLLAYCTVCSFDTISAGVPAVCSWQMSSAGQGTNGNTLLYSLLGFAGEPRTVRGDCLVDAAVFEPVPVRSAIADGCTHVLALCTRPATLHTTWHRRLVRGTVARVVKRTVLNAPYMKAAWAAEGNSTTAAKVS